MLFSGENIANLNNLWGKCQPAVEIVVQLGEEIKKLIATIEGFDALNTIKWPQNVLQEM